MREIRFLTPADREQYLTLFNSSDYFLALPKSDRLKSSWTELMDQQLADPTETYKHAGVFEDGELVSAVVGTFYKNINAWYCTSSINKTSTSLRAAKQYVQNFADVFLFTAAYGESRGYTSLYAKRPYEHQRRLEKVFFPKRYLVLHDGFYPAGTTQVTNRLHQPLFEYTNAQNPLRVSVIVSFMVLRPEPRVELLDQQHNKHRSYNNYDKNDFSPVKQS